MIENKAMYMTYAIYSEDRELLIYITLLIILIFLLFILFAHSIMSMQILAQNECDISVI